MIPANQHNKPGNAEGHGAEQGNAPRRFVGRLGDVCIFVEVDAHVEPGHQRIIVVPGADRTIAEALVALLAGADTVTVVTIQAGRRAYALPHSGPVDLRLMALVDMASSIRYWSPRMRQMCLFQTND